jgi:hypothetical protein
MLKFAPRERCCRITSGLASIPTAPATGTLRTFDELKAYLAGYVRSGDTYSSNGAAGMIQEIIAYLKEEASVRSII